MIHFLKKEHLTLACFFIFLLLGLGLFYSKSTSDNFIDIDNPLAQKEAEKISTNADLVQIKNRIIYLKVSDKYIKNIYPLLLNNLSEKEKKCLEQDKNSIGAHITLSKSKKKIDIDKFLAEPYYSFKVKKLFKLSFNNSIFTTDKISHTDKKILLTETWYNLEVDSPKALEIIESNDPYIFKKIKNSEYKLHIAIAVSKTYADSGKCFLSVNDKRIY